MITPNRIHGTGILMAEGADQSPVEYEVTAFEVNMIIRTGGWIEAGHDVLTSAQSASGALLKLTDGRIVDVSVGSFSVATQAGLNSSSAMACTGAEFREALAVGGRSSFLRTIETTPAAQRGVSHLDQS
jgi:hypothetical protein